MKIATALMNNPKDSTEVNHKPADTSEPESAKESLDSVVHRLANLPTLEYEKVRAKEAKCLSIRVAALDAEVENARGRTTKTKEEVFPTIEPWPHEIDGAELLDEIQATINRFIICDDQTVIAATLWVALTWLVDYVDIMPIAVITSPEKRCGKTNLLTVLGKLVRRPVMTSNISPAAVYRFIEANSPALLIDEADSFFRENEVLRGIINSGHSRDTAFIIRCGAEGEMFAPKRFSTWGAKAISGIGTLPGTIMDRAIKLELRRKLPHEQVEPLRHADTSTFGNLVSKLVRFSDDNCEAVRIARPDIPEELHDRAQDNWEPLLAIADLAEGEWPEKARLAAKKITDDEFHGASSADLLADIKGAFEQNVADRLTTAELLDNLISDELRPWATYYKHKPMPPRQLAGKLGGYGIHPRNIKISSETVKKGYYLADFSDAFSRYLPQDTPEKSATPLPDGEPLANIDEFGSGSSSVDDSLESQSEDVG